MSLSAKRKLAIGATGVAVLAGTGGAYAATQSGSTPTPPPDRAAEQKAFLDDVAKRLNVTRDRLDAAIKGAAEARIDAAVAAGQLTKEQGDAAKQRLENGVPLLKPGLLNGRPGGLRGFRGPRMKLFDGAAGYLGLTDAELRDQLMSGKSLAQIAQARNKPLDGLKAAIKTALTKRLDDAVANGRLMDAQRTKILADLDQRIDAIVNRTPPPRPRWR